MDGGQRPDGWKTRSEGAGVGIIGIKALTQGFAEQPFIGCTAGLNS